MTLMVLLALPPWGAVILADEAERLKLGTTTVSPIWVEPLRLPEVPLIVTG